MSFLPVTAELTSNKITNSDMKKKRNPAGVKISLLRDEAALDFLVNGKEPADTWYTTERQNKAGLHSRPNFRTYVKEYCIRNQKNRGDWKNPYADKFINGYFTPKPIKVKIEKEGKKNEQEKLLKIFLNGWLLNKRSFKTITEYVKESYGSFIKNYPEARIYSRTYLRNTLTHKFIFESKSEPGVDTSNWNISWRRLSEARGDKLAASLGKLKIEPSEPPVMLSTEPIPSGDLLAVVDELSSEGQLDDRVETSEPPVILSTEPIFSGDLLALFGELSSDAIIVEILRSQSAAQVVDVSCSVPSSSTELDNLNALLDDIPESNELEALISVPSSSTEFLKQLTESEIIKYTNFFLALQAAKEGSLLNKKNLFRKHDIIFNGSKTLESRDLLTLKDNTKLNCAIMNAVSSMLNKVAKLNGNQILCMNTHLSCINRNNQYAFDSSVDPYHEINMENGFLIIVINKEAYHWIAFIVNFKKKLFEYVDTGLRYDPNVDKWIAIHTNHILTWLTDYADSRSDKPTFDRVGWHSFKSAVNQQPDGTSCGVQILHIVINYVFGEEYHYIDTDPINVATYRLELTKLLCEGHIGIPFDEPKEVRNQLKRSLQSSVIPSERKNKVIDVVILDSTPKKRAYSTDIIIDGSPLPTKRATRNTELRQLQSNLIASSPQSKSKLDYQTEIQDKELIVSQKYSECAEVGVRTEEFVIYINEVRWEFIQSDRGMCFGKINNKYPPYTSLGEKNRCLLLSLAAGTGLHAFILHFCFRLRIKERVLEIDDAIILCNAINDTVTSTSLSIERGVLITYLQPGKFLDAVALSYLWPKEFNNYWIIIIYCTETVEKVHVWNEQTEKMNMRTNKTPHYGLHVFEPSLSSEETPRQIVLHLKNNHFTLLEFPKDEQRSPLDFVFAVKTEQKAPNCFEEVHWYDKNKRSEFSIEDMLTML